ncbi:MAG: hypothetical protein ABI670_06530 [Chloroflexota bacterium]
MNPRLPVRRFDVFAEYTRQQAVLDGMPEDEAAGYGLWVAKVVAARRYGGGPPPPRIKKSGDGKHEEDEKGAEPVEHEKWHSLGNEEQTDELFEKEVVNRMGMQFYNTVFAPAIEDAIAQGKSYSGIRDAIRREWKP